MPKKKSKSVIESDSESTLSESEIKTVEEQIEEIRQALQDNYAEQKKLMNDLRELIEANQCDVSLTKAPIREASINKVFTDFGRVETVPEPLRKLLKIDKDKMMSRSAVTKLLYEYFKKNNMFDKRTKKIIQPNNSIRKIFAMADDDIMTFYNLQSWLKKVYNAKC